MIFTQLPVGFPKLQGIVQSMDVADMAKPPPIEAIGRRLRKLFARARSTDYRQLTISAIRKLPYAYWLEGARPLPDLEGALVRRYWQRDLPLAVKSGPRRAKRWLTPLFHTYCEAFQPADAAFQDFARRVQSTIRDGEGAFSERLRELQRDVGMFEPDTAPVKLAGALMNSEGTLDQAFDAHLLWQGFVGTGFGDAVFDAALSMGPDRLSDWPVIARILDWERRLDARVVKTRHRVRFADALLLPWQRHAVPDRIKTTLIDFLTSAEQYGDPRMSGSRHYAWEGVSAEAQAVLLRWLTGDTLRAFMRVLERTADEIWRYRQRFWMAFYEAGHIQEAWLALGAQATAYANSVRSEARGMGFGTLDSGAAANQSVLLLKIGGLVFSEWSHNGSLRAYKDGSRGVPALYKSHYHGVDLRAPESLDFHDGANVHPQLAHMHSANGTWQRKARDFIRRHTGIYLGDGKIL